MQLLRVVNGVLHPARKEITKLFNVFPGRRALYVNCLNFGKTRYEVECILRAIIMYLALMSFIIFMNEVVLINDCSFGCDFLYI